MRDLLERWAVALLLAVAMLAPYRRILVGSAIPVPDDVFVSDLADGEFPGRVEVARILSGGEAPVWTPRLFTGAPLAGADPLSLLLFATLPPALALGWLIALLLLAAAFGARALARQLGASPAGAFLAGFAYAWSGVLVCQLRHLGILGTIALFPLAVLCLEKAAAASSRRRAAWLVGFAAVLGGQILFAFPQSVYISLLVCGALVAARVAGILAAGEPGRVSRAAELGVGALAAVAGGVLVGMAALLPMRELGALSDRSGGGTFAWATQLAYWPRNVLTFLFPYANGDISNLTYHGPSLFWEDYGYVGLATLLLALVAVAVRLRRFAVAFWAGAAAVAYLFVLGPATPFFRVAFEVLPGLKTFRFPTRFLFVVELALALLGALGLTLLEERLRKRPDGPVPLAVVLLVAFTVTDLVHHNARQNPFADASRWLAPPRSASIIRARSDGEGERVFAPGSVVTHTEMLLASHGWSGDLSRFLAHREFLQPDSNLLHGVATLDGYTGISPRWTVDLIGDHNRQGLLGDLYQIGPDGLRASPAFFGWLEALSVRWLILPFRARLDRAQWAGSAPPAEVYRLTQTLPRARVVARARIVPSTEELRRLVASGGIDPRREVILSDPGAASLVAALPGGPPEDTLAGTARIVLDRATQVVVEASSPRGGLLLLADTWYPGWKATVDERAVEILRANVAHRAVPLPPGDHRVAFTYRSEAASRGIALSAAGAFLLAAAALGIAIRGSRAP